MRTAEQPLIEGEVVATSGDLVTRLEASGQSLAWHVDDLGAFRSATPVLGRGEVGRLADRLARFSLSLAISDSSGPVLEIGSVRGSIVGKLLFGTRRVRIRRPWTWWRTRP